MDYFDGLLDDLTPNQFQSLLVYLIGKMVTRANVNHWRRINGLPFDKD